MLNIALHRGQNGMFLVPCQPTYIYADDEYKMSMSFMKYRTDEDIIAKFWHFHIHE